jgi:hypothetical protein
LFFIFFYFLFLVTILQNVSPVQKQWNIRSFMNCYVAVVVVVLAEVEVEVVMELRAVVRRVQY